VTLALGCSQPASRVPDVVIITLDTTRADRLGCYGGKRPISPNIDQLAREGVLFERAWTTASWTLPAHASLLTGQYPSAHGARITPFSDADSNGKNPARLRQSAVTLAELLAARGYRTAAFAGAGWLSPEFGLLQGYEVQDGENNRTLPADQITQRALHWLDRIPEDQPLHLLVNYFDPHWPFTPLPGYDRYARGREHIKLPRLGQSAISKAQYAKMRDLYDGEIEFMDAHVGRLLDGLRERGRYEDAIIVVIADHGELIGEHGNLGHGAWLWEELMRVPLIVRYPAGRGGGERILHSVSIVDVLTWIGAELGLALPDNVDGLPVGERDVVLAEEFPNSIFRKAGLDRDLVSGVRWPWKLISSNAGDRDLFRIDRDPSEQRAVDNEGVAVELERAIERIRSTLVLPPTVRGRDMSREAREQLKQLGYIE
jgi:arylsulfatase A-like enzyme